MKNLIKFAAIAALAFASCAGSALAHGHGDRHHDRHPASAGYRDLHRPSVATRFTTRFEKRQDRQADRIRHGRRSGALTRDESRRLKREQRRIAQVHERFHEDGTLSRSERRRLEAMQDRASRRIARFKHNEAQRDRHRYREEDRGRDFRYFVMLNW